MYGEEHVFVEHSLSDDDRQYRVSDEGGRERSTHQPRSAFTNNSDVRRQAEDAG
jgi:hypothetical protein